jgi:DNA-binding MarR family transcriptional regulator
MDIFTAIAEPTRRSILEMLASKGELSATEISDTFASSPPAISQHLKVLRAMGQYKGTKWPMLGKFTVVEPNAKLSYDVKAWVGEQQNEETTIDQTTELTSAAEKRRYTIIRKACALAQ